MPRLGLKRGALAAISLAATALAPASAQAALLDASCPGPADVSTVAYPPDRFAETFTALHTGTAVRAEMVINKAAPAEEFRLQILPTSGGVPTNQVLGTATIPDSSVPSGDATLAGSFAAPVNVTAGTLYALVVSRAGLQPFYLLGPNVSQCPGDLFYSSSSTNPFVPTVGGFEPIFQIFVNPPNDFTVGKLKGRKLFLTVPGPGQASVSNAGGGGKSAIASAKKLLKTSKTTAAAAGTVKVKVKLTKAGNALLASKGKLKAKAAITYTPTGGEPKTLKRKLKLK